MGLTAAEAVDRVKIGWFVKMGYELHGVVHVGANDGYEVPFYKVLRLKIMAFEPLPHAFAKLQARRCECYRMALGNINGTVLLNVSKGDGQGSSCLDELRGDYTIEDTIEVPMKRLADLIIDPAHDTLVVDVQGMELDVLRGADDKLRQFKYLNIECSEKPIYAGGASADEVIAYLAKFGFVQVTPTVEHNDILFVHESVLKDAPAPPIAHVEPPPAATKLNIGSGQRRFDTAEGWCNIDCVSRPPDQVPDLVCDVGREPLPYDDDSMDYCVAYHNLEHYHWGPEMDRVVAEMYRVLRPSGSAIIVVPDVRALAQRWLLGQIDDYILMANVYGAWQGQPGDDHHWGFSPDSLRRYLSQWGWRVQPFDHRPIAGMNAPHDWWMISMECAK